MDLLEGELKIDNVNYQYIGKDIDLNFLNSKNKENVINYKDTKIFYENGISVDIDEANNLIKIDQQKIGSRVYISDGKLENISIVFNGIKPPSDEILTLTSPQITLSIKGG